MCEKGEQEVKHLIFVAYTQPLMTQFYEVLKMHKSEDFNTEMCLFLNS